MAEQNCVCSNYVTFHGIAKYVAARRREDDSSRCVYHMRIHEMNGGRCPPLAEDQDYYPINSTGTYGNMRNATPCPQCAHPEWFQPTITEEEFIEDVL